MAAPNTISGLTGALLGGRYHLLRLIKAGGMGAVYEAKDIKMERPVAVKILSAELTREPGMVRRLFREARAAAQIRHSNIVEYLDYDQTADGAAYLVMELLNGGDLEGVLKQQGPIPWPTLAPWLRGACRALSAAHAVGIIHRDIKPSNFVLDERPGLDDPILKLVDFGIVKLTPLSELRGDTEMTQNLLGTEMFMAPEIFTGVTPNPRTEVYALGVSIYRLLTGKYPRSETSEPPPPSHFCPGLPPEVDALVSKCIDVRPLARFDSMDAVDAAILATLTGKDYSMAPPLARVTAPSISTPTLAAPPRTRGRVAIMTAIVACVGSILMFTNAWWSPEPETLAIPSSLKEASGKAPPRKPEREPTVNLKTAPEPVVVPDRGLDFAPKPEPIPRPESEPTRKPPFSRKAARTLLATLSDEAVACGKKANLVLGGQVELTIQVSPDGVPKAKAKRMGTFAHVRCVVRLVNTQAFEPSMSGGQLTYIYKM